MFALSKFVRLGAAAAVAALAGLLSGPLRGETVQEKPLQIGGARIEIELLTAEPAPPALREWIENAARAVTAYYGRFPVPLVRLHIRLTPGSGVRNGRTDGARDGADIAISVGVRTDAAGFREDWILTHEMVHTALPSVPRRHHWLEEGIAVYVEPLARAQAGQLSRERVWGDVARDLPQGLPERGDRGLDFTATWGRIYWGGALFCLQADIEIRRRTKNAKGLEDALRGIQRAGGSIAVDWDLARVLRTGDEATGVPVLQELYAKMRGDPGDVDLAALWRDLGVARGPNGKVSFDDRAPLAAARDQIVRGPQAK